MFSPVRPDGHAAKHLPVASTPASLSTGCAFVAECWCFSFRHIGRIAAHTSGRTGRSACLWTSASSVV